MPVGGAAPRTFAPGGKNPRAATEVHISCISLRFNGHFFPGGPGLAGTRMPPFGILLELRVMEVVVTTGAIRRAKLGSKCHHQQTTLNSVKALEGK